MYKKALKEINNFFMLDIRKSPEYVFSVLKEIINFQSGQICLSGNRKYSCNPENIQKFEITEDLKIKNAKFGYIKITRNTEFTEGEKNIFTTCAAIISNLIKDAEISEIISQQVKTLKEGILETNKAYKTAKIQNDFFANFSHELRTPLNAIISSSELLAEKIFGNLNEKQAEYINDIRIAALHLLGMINDILDMSKLESNSMKLNVTNFELKQTSDEVCNILKPLAKKKNINIIKKKTKNTMIMADYNKIQQILFNLITNAIKYTEKNGEINISINREGEFTILKVKDNGIGIDKKYHKKIFDKFVQIGSENNSNGLGLTITKELTKLHKGRIFLESKPGQGSQFILKLPTKGCNFCKNMIK